VNTITVNSSALS